MEKIKNSFTKAFLPILIASVMISLLNIVEDQAFGGVWYLFDKLSGHIKYSRSGDFILNGMRYFVNFIFAMATSPFLCGIYSFCFARLNDERSNVGKIFYFYRSFKRIIMSVVSVRLLSVFFEIQFIFKSLQSLYTEKGFPAPTVYTAGVVLSTLLYIAAALFLYFWRFTYSEAPESGLTAALKKSCRCILAAVPILILLAALYFISTKITLISNGNYFYLILFIYYAIRNWIGFTIYYMAVSGVKAKSTAENADIDNTYEYADETENEVEEPFIKPYDFFIEADERFSDEKTVETENIRGVDIIAVFDEMELADDIKVNHSIRKKLKRMFDDLSFEIGEFVTYQGGRSIGSDFTEEIDDLSFEISVDISRNSDSEPFKLILRVNISDHEE